MQGSEPGYGISGLARVDLNLLVHLFVILEERSVSRAATRVGLSQPAMSHALSRCRKLLDDDLLVRSGLHMLPTSRALQLVEPLRTLLEAVDHDVLRRPGFDPLTSQRQFQIAATSSTTLVLLPGLLQRFSTTAPGVSIQVLTALTNGDDIRDSPEMELGVIADQVPTSLPREPLYDDSWLVIAAPDNDFAGAPMSLDLLASVPHIAYESGGGSIPVYREIEERGIHVRFHLRTPDFGMIPSLVARSRDLAIVQARLAAVFEARGAIRTWPLPIEIPPLSVGMIVNPRFERDPATRWLRQEIRDLVASRG
jgi:DNA-binding transcriptional LysR family regulator